MGMPTPVEMYNITSFAFLQENNSKIVLVGNIFFTKSL